MSYGKSKKTKLEGLRSAVQGLANQLAEARYALKTFEEIAHPAKNVIPAEYATAVAPLIERIENRRSLLTDVTQELAEYEKSNT